jgi:hypothetical protein
MRAHASARLAVILPVGSTPESCVMLERVFLVSLIILAMAAATRIGIAAAAPMARHRRIKWDGPADADS